MILNKPIVFDKKVRDSIECNRQGLKHLYWELFDSPDAPGSAFRYMEREPVLILDDIVTEFEKYRPKIEVAYVSKSYGDLLGLPSSSPHRIGKAIRFRTTNPTQRMFIVTELIRRGVSRIGVGKEHVYFDTDNYLKKDALYVQS